MKSGASLEAPMVPMVSSWAWTRLAKPRAAATLSPTTNQRRIFCIGAMCPPRYLQTGCRNLSTQRKAPPAAWLRGERSQPRHEGGVDHIRHALPAHRFDGAVDVIEAEAVGGDQLQRKAF